MDCIFCKLAHKEIPTEILYEDDYVVAFPDQNPQAPVHVLIIPKKHISSMNAVTVEYSEILMHVVMAAQKIAQDKGIAERGYRLVNNCGKEGGQTVGHLHFHLLGGRDMLWPAG